MLKSQNILVKLMLGGGEGDILYLNKCISSFMFFGIGDICIVKPAM